MELLKAYSMLVNIFGYELDGALHVKSYEDSNSKHLLVCTLYYS